MTVQLSGLSDDPLVDAAPFYLPVGREVEVFLAAARRGVPVLLKGPTGCGKTRFIEAMSHELGRELITVAGHEDLTSADLVGRFLLQEFGVTDDRHEGVVEIVADAAGHLAEGAKAFLLHDLPLAGLEIGERLLQFPGALGDF